MPREKQCGGAGVGGGWRVKQCVWLWRLSLRLQRGGIFWGKLWQHGGGGGKDSIATAGGKNIEKLDKALEQADSLIRKLLDERL